MLKKTFVILAAAVFIAGNVATMQAADRVLASVNGEQIFESEFNSIYDPILAQYRQVTPPSEQTDARITELRNSILDQRIDYLLLKQQAKKQGIKATNKEIRDAVAQIKTRFPSEAAFRDELKRENLTNAQFERRVADDIANTNLIRSVVEKQITPPTDAQVRAFYDQVQLKIKGRKTTLPADEDQVAQNVADQIKRLSGPQVRWRMILIADPKGSPAADAKIARDRAQEVKDALRKGDFAQVAAQYSQDETSRQRGGDMGFIAKGDLTATSPALDKALFGLAVNKYTTDPVKTDIGYFFVKVEEKITGRDVTYNDIANQLAEVVYQNEARKAYTAWLNDLKSKSTIKKNA
ncbi:MAG: SurA N-terminal domain-containing protein [Elusimicrobiota bacterium]|jgi:parvulin-like peptidyl-prolyl isomerase|nr:SurA N-terminal domain-containing protein [Elusimicrobiota bacterium]